MRLFKRNKETAKKHTDFSQYKIKINGKVMCAYESMTGRPFLKVETEDDIKHLFYCSLVINNEEFSTLEYDVFEFLIEDQEVLKWISDEYIKIGRFLAQFKSTIGDLVEDDEDEGSGKTDDRVFYMLDAIPGLIVKMGIDPNYVMYDMAEWEIAYYYRIMRDVDRDRLSEERLWTYLQVLPHVGKKIGGPEKMLPFPWEDNKKKIQKDLEKNTPAIVAFLGRQNGKRLNTDSEQGGLPESDGPASITG